MEVTDLCEDLSEGTKLITLVELLTNEKLVCACMCTLVPLSCLLMLPPLHVYMCFTTITYSYFTV